jgi:hypothetical protein
VSLCASMARDPGVLRDYIDSLGWQVEIALRKAAA